MGLNLRRRQRNIQCALKSLEKCSTCKNHRQSAPQATAFSIVIYRQIWTTRSPSLFFFFFFFMFYVYMQPCGLWQTWASLRTKNLARLEAPYMYISALSRRNYHDLSGLGLHDIGSHHITCILSHAFQPIHSIGVDIEYKTSVGQRPCLETSAHLPQFALSCSQYRGPTPDPEGYFPTFDRIDRVDSRAHTASPRNLDLVAHEKSLNKLCDRKYDLSVINLISNTVCWRQKYRDFADSNLFLHDCCLLIIVRPCIRSKIGRLLRKVCRVGLE